MVSLAGEHILFSPVVFHRILNFKLQPEENNTHFLSFLISHFFFISSLFSPFFLSHPCKAGLPLKWPDAVMSMFTTMSTLSSAGSTLLIPDCELTDLPSADTFFIKQIAFALLVPATVLFISFLCC